MYIMGRKYMALHIVNAEANALARELAALTGQSLSAAVVEALREKLQRVRGERSQTARLEKMREIAARSRRKCKMDNRSPEAIIGYDDHGLPR